MFDLEQVIVQGISTDTREDLSGKLFVPLRGERFDGHDYIELALQKGAVAVLSEPQPPSDIRNPKIFYVNSTYTALKEMAEYYRSRFHLKVVAVTGSVGKTTTKDLIASVLSQRYRVLKTRGNLNNEIGLPQMVFQIDQTYDYAVLEMGMNHFGEIRALSRIAKPDICVITNIGVAHIENLGSREGILKAKSEVFEYMNPDGIAVLNGDDTYLRSLEGGADDICACRPKHMRFFGINEGNDYIASDYDLNIPLPGKHMVYNAMAATAVGDLACLSLDEIKAGIEGFRPSKNRMEFIKAPLFTLISDCYNANPDSMNAALHVLSEMKTRKVAILGDMFELGTEARVMHYEVGRLAAALSIDLMICVGELAAEIADGFSDITAYCYPDKTSCITALPEILKPDDTILIKASRAMAFEEITEYLRAFKI